MDTFHAVSRDRRHTCRTEHSFTETRHLSNKKNFWKIFCFQTLTFDFSKLALAKTKKSEYFVVENWCSWKYFLQKLEIYLKLLLKKISLVLFSNCDLWSLTHQHSQKRKNLSSLKPKEKKLMDALEKTILRKVKCF